MARLGLTRDPHSPWFRFCAADTPGHVYHLAYTSAYQSLNGRRFEDHGESIAEDFLREALLPKVARGGPVAR